MPLGDTKRLFSWADYFVFGLMLAISTAIGLYHGCNFWPKKKRRNVQDDNQGHSKSGEFLVANGRMKTLPVALSMLASFLSSITLIGQPAEVYVFGTQLWLFGIASVFAIPLIVNYFVPFFQRKKLTSAYQYFGKRFNRKLQFMASLLFTLQMVLYLALVLYAPALALHRVTGLNTEVIVTVMYVVVILYTSVGGMKAVVWSDCFQVVVLYSSMLAIIIKGTIDIGGISVIWQRNYESGRTNFFNWDFDPTERYTMWGTLIGAAFLHTAVYGGNQLQTQRYLTVSTLKQARNMLWINTFGWTAIVLITVYTGMLIFAHYYRCDPLLSKEIKKPDEIFPLYVMDVLGEYQGFPGLFVAGIFSAGLSTVSTGLNALAAIWFAELDGTKFKSNLSDRNAGLTVKLISLIFGLISFALIFVVPYMGGLAPVAISLSSFFSGSLFGVFLLGMFIPFSNTAGASAGLIAGIGLVSWLSVGAHLSTTSGLQVAAPLPRSTEGCVNISNSSFINIDNGPRESAFVLYRISFLWYSLLSTFITVFVGVVVSLMYTFVINVIKKRRPEYYVESVNNRRNDIDSPSLEVGANSVVEDTDVFLLKAGKKEPQAFQESVSGKVKRLTNDL